ncbi:MAG: type II toxin-antitoxin system VapC family toxin [Fibrobacteres bacterium]|nr:type II toxin-antitoxin system VapC family toxin [Fibrobacterota bacterium]
MKKIILDTNAYSRLMNGDKEVLNVISNSETIYFSVFVIGELNAGFAGGKHEKKNHEILKEFLEKSSVKTLSATIETARIFGIIKNSLKQAATPIPINDVWIASHCMETGATLVSYDSHFKAVKGLLIWDSN